MEKTKWMVKKTGDNVDRKTVDRETATKSQSNLSCVFQCYVYNGGQREITQNYRLINLEHVQWWS